MYKNSHIQDMLIQIHANLYKNYFPQNIVFAKYNTFTVYWMIGYEIHLTFLEFCVLSTDNSNSWTMHHSFKPERFLVKDVQLLHATDPVRKRYTMSIINSYTSAFNWT